MVAGFEPIPASASGGTEIVSLGRDEALTLTLPRHSRFTSYQLAEHVSAHPNLAYRVADAPLYVVGGFWRRRPEIGIVLEMVPGHNREALLHALLEAYRDAGSALVLLDPREQERNMAFYRHRGFVLVETLLQLEKRGLRVTEATRPTAIRAMEEKDVTAVLDVERHSFPWLWWNSEAEFLWYASVMGVELHVALAADRPDRVVGYVGFTVFDDEAHLDRLAVHEDFQRSGYGGALLAFSLQRMSELGARRVALTTQIDNFQSQALYRKFGFRASEWQHGVFGLWLRQPSDGKLP